MPTGIFSDGRLLLEGLNIYFIIPNYAGPAGVKELWIGCNRANPTAPFLMATYAAMGKSFTLNFEDPIYQNAKDRYEARCPGVEFLGSSRAKAN